MKEEVLKELIYEVMNFVTSLNTNHGRLEALYKPPGMQDGDRFDHVLFRWHKMLNESLDGEEK